MTICSQGKQQKSYDGVAHYSLKFKDTSTAVLEFVKQSFREGEKACKVSGYNSYQCRALTEGINVLIKYGYARL